MGRLKEWKERNQRELEYYSQERDRIWKEMTKLDPTSEAYRTMQGVLANHQANEEVRKESRRKILKSDRGKIAVGIIGGLGTAGMIAAIGYHERGGHMFSGMIQKGVESIVRLNGSIVGSFLKIK